MPSTLIRKRNQNKILPIIYVIDKSKNMTKEKCDVVNLVMKNMLDALAVLAKENDKIVQVAAFTFNTTVK